MPIYKHYNHTLFQCPALIYHTHFSYDPGDAPGGMGAEQFDRRINDNLFITCVQNIDLRVRGLVCKLC